MKEASVILKEASVILKEASVILREASVILTDDYYMVARKYGKTEEMMLISSVQNGII